SRGPHAIQRSATAPPPRSERWGVGGHLGALTQSRGARRLRRRAPNVGGLAAISGPSRNPEERDGSAAALRTSGGWRPSGPSRNPEERDGSAGTLRTLGGLGAISGPPCSKDLTEPSGQPAADARQEHAVGEVERRSADGL